jgi:protein subunit release factor B
MRPSATDALAPSLTGPRLAAGAFVQVEGDPGWARTLLRMYQRWAERAGLKWSWIDGRPEAHPEDHPSGMILIEGPDAFGLLRGETGVHGLDDGGAYSFAAVDVLPNIDPPAIPAAELSSEIIPLGERLTLG